MLCYADFQNSMIPEDQTIILTALVQNKKQKANRKKACL